MTQVFNPDGSRVPVTAIEVGPCTVVQKRTVEKDGYVALQLGFAEKKEHRANRAELGHFKKAEVTPKQHLLEFRCSQEDADKYQVGQEIRVDMFTNGDRIDIRGTSKGKGFAGLIKTYGFGGAKASHGAHEFYRHAGSIGMHQDPGRVFKGTRMTGRHSHRTVTVQSMEVVRVFSQDNILFIRGTIPGSRNSIVQLRHTDRG